MSDTARAESGWKPTACILCECNCGIEVELGGSDGREFARIRGDRAHPASKGYTCQKALRLNYYQNGRGERVLHPLRRRPDGSFEELASLRDETPPGDSPDWPFLLSAGERRSFTANTIVRDPDWRRKDGEGALRVSPADAAALGLSDGGAAR